MSSSKSYLNFDLLLSGDKDHYRAKVTDSPDGQASLDFTLPFSKIELENFILKTSQNRSNVRSLSLESVDLQSVEELGESLFDCLFSGDIAQRYRSSLAIARSQDVGLRLRLGFSDAPTLIDIPWELLFDSDNNDYLGLSTETPIIRKLDLASLPRLRQVEECLQVLVMISSPKGHAPLDVESEWERIRQATETLQKSKRIVLTRIEPSLLALQRQLRKGEFHIFHYIGHGGFSRLDNDGVLVLEDREQKGDLVSGQQLGTILNNHSSLQLAFLNSCHGGRTSVADPFAGVGQALLQKRVPAVIAMQFEITDEAAIIFSEEFYSALVDGYSIETAVAEARKMIFASGNKLEWATPVLYTGIEGGRLLTKVPINEQVAEPVQDELSQQNGQSNSSEEHLQAPNKREQPKSPRSRLNYKLLFTGLILIAFLSMIVLYFQLFSTESEGDMVSKSGLSVRGKVYKLPNRLTLLPIPAGSFIMGSDSGAGVESPAHEVIFAKPFWMSKTEITFDQYDAYANHTGKSFPMDNGWGRGSRPVINVSWNDAQGYVRSLSANNNRNLQCRLPSEAEWEYASRAGNTTKYSWGDSIGKNKANCVGCGSQWDDKETAPVGSFSSNAWGLHDMHGNVWEWVQDPWHENYKGAPNNGDVWESGGDTRRRVYRGGSWNDEPSVMRSTYRYGHSPDLESKSLGFRIVCFTPSVR